MTAFLKPKLYYNNSLRTAQEGDDGTAYAVCAKAIEYPLDRTKMLGVIANAADISALSSLIGSQVKFDSTGNAYRITAAPAFPGNPKNIALRAIAWSGSLYVACGDADGTDAYIITSPDGFTWTERSNPKNFALYGICWDGSQFCAVGAADGVNSYIVTSPDGIIWTEQSPTVARNLALYGVCWSGSLFIAVGEKAGGSKLTILSSTDGITWVEVSPATTQKVSLFSVIWSGVLFVAVGAGDAVNSYIMTSSDGTTWTEQSPTVDKNIALNSVTWSSTLSLFVAVGAADGTNSYLLTSSDGTTWTERSPTVDKNIALNAVTWDGSQFMAVGSADGSDAYILTSSDGTTWTEQANSANFALYGVVWSGSWFLGVGAADGTDAYTVITQDGIIYPDDILYIFESLQDADIGGSFTIRSGLACAQAAASTPVQYLADNHLSPYFVGTVNTEHKIRIHAPNFLVDGGFESGVLPAGAGANWSIDSATELEGAYSAKWDAAANTTIPLAGIGKLVAGKTYILTYKAQALTAPTLVDVLTVGITANTSGTALDADLDGTSPIITSANPLWVTHEITPDFSTDAWTLTFTPATAQKDSATAVIIDEVYLYEKKTINSLIFAGHNWNSKGAIKVNAWKLSPLRSTATAHAALDKVEIGSFSVDSTDTITQALTSSTYPVFEIVLPAVANWTPEAGEAYLGDYWTLPKYPKPFDPYATDDSRLRSMSLSFDGLPPAYRKLNIEDLFTKLRADEPIWVTHDADLPILMEDTQKAKGAAYNPWTVDLSLTLTEKL